MIVERGPRVVIATDKFKGSLSARGVADALKRGILDELPTASVKTVPIADGGEGTVEAAVAAGFDMLTAAATGPLGDPVQATFAVRGTCAVVELATASGLGLLEPNTYDALHSTTRGTGDLIRSALNRGCTRIILGVGGSASTDGGAGMLQALGADLRDVEGSELEPGGLALRHLAHIDMSQLDRRLTDVAFILATDVNNPLLGPHGAAAIYGPQKGASSADLAVLERALQRWSELLDPDAALLPGSGAGGGAGYGAMAGLRATREPGVDVVLDMVGFDDALNNADLVITGEGHMDLQSLNGKAPMGVVSAARKRGIPTIAVNGQCSLSPDLLRDAGLAGWLSIAKFEPDPARWFAHASEVLEGIGSTIAAEWQRYAFEES